MTRRSVTLLVVLALCLAGAGTAIVLRRQATRRPDVAPHRVMTHEEQVRHHLYAALQPVKVSNCKLERFGEANDGGYLLCGNLLAEVRAGYSYGISNYDGWGCEISKRLQIPLHQYDCFDVRVPECPGGRTTFHPECVAGSRATIDGRPFDSIEHQLLANGDGGKRLVVKVDVEGAEWDAFLQTPDAVFSRIDQMAVEFHEVGEPRFILVVEKLKTLFYVAHLHFNNFSCNPALAPFPSRAYEVLFVNKRIGVSDGSPAATGPAPIDSPNDPETKDCQTAPIRGAE